MFFLVYMYYTHPSYRTSIVGNKCAYYIRIFTVVTGMKIYHHHHHHHQQQKCFVSTTVSK